MKNKIIPSHFFTVKEQSLVSLVCQAKSQFIIPYNQRPWSWKEKQINDLWTDILKTVNGYFHASSVNDSWEERATPISDPHFIGAFVFEEKGNDYYVVDGQQRLTSLTMFIASLRNETTKLKNETSNSSLNKAARFYLDNFKSWLIADYSDDVISTRLKVDENYQDFFTGYIIEPENDQERFNFISDFEKENDLSQEPNLAAFRKSFDSMSKKLSDYLSSFDSHEKKYKVIKAILSTIEDCFICIAADVKRESFSYEVFKCLNAKGLPLSQGDKLKNELFTQSKINEHEEIKELWDLISENTPYSAVAQFIRLRYVALKSECPESKLHEIITESELKEKDVPSAIKEWADDSKIYAKITLEKNTGDRNGFTTDERKYLEDLKTLKITLSTILVFSAYKKFFKSDREKFLEILRITRNFCFRNLTIGKKGTDSLEQHLGRAARDITNDKALKDIRQNLRKASPNEEFIESFKSFSTNNSKIQFFILENLEKIHLNSGLTTKSHGEELNIEHIMPKKFNKIESRKGEWDFAKENPEIHRLMINRIGNVCLLEGEINKDVSSFDYLSKKTGDYIDQFKIKKKNEKRKSYKDSSVPSIKKIIDEYPEWNFDSIQERQNKMADDALKAWSLDAPEQL